MKTAAGFIPAKLSYLIVPFSAIKGHLKRSTALEFFCKYRILYGVLQLIGLHYLPHETIHGELLFQFGYFSGYSGTRRVM